MKTLSVTILAFLYLGLTSGIVKSVHYCMGQLSNVEYGYDQHDACGKCGMQEKDGCCDTELHLIKVEDSHHAAKWTSIEKKLVILAAPEYHYPGIIQSTDRLHYDLTYHSPPDRRSNLVYNYTGVLLI